MAHLAFPVLLPGQVQAIWVPTLADDGDDDSELTRQEQELEAELLAVRMQEAPVPIGNLVKRDVDTEEIQQGQHDAEPVVDEESEGEDDEEEDEEEEEGSEGSLVEGEEGESEDGEEEDDDDDDDDDGEEEEEEDDEDEDEDEDDEEEESEEESEEHDGMGGFASPEPSTSLGRDVEWT
jgi:hypothetical protein